MRCIFFVVDITDLATAWMIHHICWYTAVPSGIMYIPHPSLSVSERANVDACLSTSHSKTDPLSWLLFEEGDYEKVL